MPDSDAARARAALTSSCVRCFACRKAILFSTGDEATLGSCKTGTEELAPIHMFQTLSSLEVGLHLAAEATRSSRMAMVTELQLGRPLHLVPERVCLVQTTEDAWDAQMLDE